MTSPITTEGSIEDNIIVLEMLIDITPTPTLERCNRVAPGSWVGSIASSTIRNTIPAEEPDIDRVTSPFHSIHAAVSVIETIAVGCRTAGYDTAAGIALTVFIDHRATRASVHCHGVFRLVADTLYDIDFATVWPGGAGHPESGPDTAGAAGHVLQVQYYQAVRVLGLACQTDAVATASAGYGCGIRADGDDAVFNVCEIVLLGGVGVDVIYVAVSGVVFSVEGEHVEEIVSAVIILNAVGG